MKKIIVAYFFVSFILFPLLSLAQAEGTSEGLVPCGPGTSKQTCTLCDFFVMIARIIDFIFFKIVPALLVLMIAIGGFMYIVAFLGPEGGGPGMLGKAKSTIQAALFGALIVYGSWIIIDLFLTVIGAKDKFLGSWNTINCY